MKQKGLTLIEALSGLALIGILVLAFGGAAWNTVMNNRGATEQRAQEGAEQFIEKNNLDVVRMTCAGDSDGDGYGSCSVVQSGGERIRLKCPTDWFDVNVWGASGCKEEFTDLQLGGHQ